MLIRCNTLAVWRTTSIIQTNGDHSVDKTHVLVLTVDLIWLLFLNILSFKFVAAPRKSLRFTRFIRSYVNHPGVVLTNHCQSYTAFLLDVRCLKLPCSIFLQLFIRNDSAFALFSIYYLFHFYSIKIRIRFFTSHISMDYLHRLKTLCQINITE